MPKIINVLIAVDTDRLVNGQSNIYMVSDNPSDEHKGTSELTIVAKIGDYIHWRTVAINCRDEVELINFDKKGGVSVVENPYFANDCWTTETIATGEEDYSFTFSINGRGVFTWDPHVIVNPA